MIVSKSSFARFELDSAMRAWGQEYVLFDQYSPNPDYEDIILGVKLFVDEKCDAILAIGGGSTIDVAKCIKAYCNMNHEQDYMAQTISDSGIPFIAIPTTAGSGSEVTPNAVIYRNKVKQSVADKCLKPNFVILDGNVLKSLPLYQKKCTVMDALAQAIEAWWSIKSTEESREYSKQAVAMIIKDIRAYVSGDESVCQNIMEASNLAGKAIAIAGTTVPHAMSYRLTGLYGIAHGHGVILSLPRVWEHMTGNLEQCNDVRGSQYVKGVFEDIAISLGADSVSGGIGILDDLINELEMEFPQSKSLQDDLNNLTGSVPDSKLNTNPVKTTSEDVYGMYSKFVLDNSNADYEWAKALCEYAGENEQYLQEFWSMLKNSEGVMAEYSYYRNYGQFLGKHSVAGMTLIDIMIWQMDHFKSDLDRGLYDMQSNPDKMLLSAFVTMLKMEMNPEPYMNQFTQDTGTEYPGKY